MLLSRKSKKPNKPSYEDLGRMLTSIYESGYIDRKQTYKMSFVKGLLSGLGGVIGATILVGLMLWILSLFSHVPVLDRLVNNVQHTLKTQKN